MAAAPVGGDRGRSATIPRPRAPVRALRLRYAKHGRRMSADLRAGHGFPITRVSVIAALADPNDETRRAAGDLFARAYWMPIATTLRARWRLDGADAEDM